MIIKPKKTLVAGKIAEIKKMSAREERAVKIDEVLARADTLVDDMYSEEEAAMITASKIDLPSGFLSPTQIDMYLRCPYQFYRRYILGQKSPPAVAMVEGTTHHKVCEKNNLNKIKTGKDLPSGELEEYFADTWSDQQKEVEDWEKDRPDAILKRGRGLIRTYSRDFAPLLRPRNAERTTAVPVGPLKVLCVIDVDGFIIPPSKAAPGRTDIPVICDYKTVSKARSQGEVDSSLQLSMCAYAHRIDTGEKKLNVGLCSLVKTTGLVKWTPSTSKLEGRIRWFRRIALSVANSISLGNFPLTSPSEWWCSERFCGYYKDCRGKVEGCR